MTVLAALLSVLASSVQALVSYRVRVLSVADPNQRSPSKTAAHLCPAWLAVKATDQVVPSLELMISPESGRQV